MQSVPMPLCSSTGLRSVLLLVLATAAGCGSDDESGNGDDGGPSDAGVDAAVNAAVAPVFRNPVELPDDELADAVLELLDTPVSGPDDNCSRCHGVGRQTLRHWRALGDQSLATCLTNLEVSDAAAAQEMIDCLRDEPADPESMFKAEKLGVYSTGAHLPWFAHLFELAYGADGPELHQAFVAQLGMPRGGEVPFEQDAFDLIAEYFIRGLPLLDAKVIEEPQPTECTSGVSKDVAAHVTAMSTQGWAALNRDNDLLMHGCPVDAAPIDCLTDEPLEADWVQLPGSVVRSLQVVPYRSAFWTRSSADGRFVGHGTKPNGAAFVDLQTDTVIDANAFYDPGFFPDNSGFAFQASSALFCEQQVLTATPTPTEITFNEPGCSANEEVGLYQHLGAALDGGDYWTVHGQFDSDDGGHSATLEDPPATADQSSHIRLTPMIHTSNTGYEPRATIAVHSPWEGDAVLSPSAQLVITRVAGASGQLGFVMRKVEATPTKEGYDVEIPEVAATASTAASPASRSTSAGSSYHHYVGDADAVDLGFDGPDDPAFAPYLDQGAANLYVLDLLDRHHHAGDQHGAGPVRALPALPLGRLDLLSSCATGPPARRSRPATRRWCWRRRRTAMATRRARGGHGGGAGRRCRLRGRTWRSRRRRRLRRRRRRLRGRAAPAPRSLPDRKHRRARRRPTRPTARCAGASASCAASLPARREAAWTRRRARRWPRSRSPSDLPSGLPGASCRAGRPGTASDDCPALFHRLYRGLGAGAAARRARRSPTPRSTRRFALEPAAVDEAASWPEPSASQAYLAAIDERSRGRRHRRHLAGRLQPGRGAPPARPVTRGSLACVDGAPPPPFGRRAEPRGPRSWCARRSTLGACERRELRARTSSAGGEELQRRRRRRTARWRCALRAGPPRRASRASAPQRRRAAASAGPGPRSRSTVAAGEAGGRRRRPSTTRGRAAVGRRAWPAPFPLDAAVVKADWRRAEFGEHAAAHDTSAGGLARRLGRRAATWGDGDAQADPGPDDIYTRRTAQRRRATGWPGSTS